MDFNGAKFQITFCNNGLIFKLLVGKSNCMEIPLIVDVMRCRKTPNRLLLDWKCTPRPNCTWAWSVHRERAANRASLDNTIQVHRALVPAQHTITILIVGKYVDKCRDIVSWQGPSIKNAIFITTHYLAPGKPDKFQ